MREDSESGIISWGDPSEMKEDDSEPSILEIPDKPILMNSQRSKAKW